MILYGINNIRDLFGHKVLLYALSLFWLWSHIILIMDLVHSFVSCFLQVDLGLIKTNPICDLGVWLSDVSVYFCCKMFDI